MDPDRPLCPYGCQTRSRPGVLGTVVAYTAKAVCTVFAENLCGSACLGPRLTKQYWRLHRLTWLCSHLGVRAYLHRCTGKLFLAIISAIGIVTVGAGHCAVGVALVFAGAGSMAAAAVVLLLSAPDKARAALMQGTFPVIAIVLLLLGLPS